MKHARIVAENFIRKNEGVRTKPYKDTRGILTIGVGHNLTNGISENAVNFIFNEDLDKAEMDLKKYIPQIFDNLDANRQIVLLDMCFNLGIGGLLKFKKMLSALAEENYELAGFELMNSAYAKQVPARAEENKNILITGEIK